MYFYVQKYIKYAYWEVKRPKNVTFTASASETVKPDTTCQETEDVPSTPHNKPQKTLRRKVPSQYCPDRSPGMAHAQTRASGK